MVPEPSLIPPYNSEVIDVVLAIYDSKLNVTNSSNVKYLQFKATDVIYVLYKHNSGWWDGFIISNGIVKRGWFPNNFTSSMKKRPSFKRIAITNLNNLSNTSTSPPLANASANVRRRSLSSIDELQQFTNVKDLDTFSNQRYPPITTSSSSASLMHDLNYNRGKSDEIASNTINNNKNGNSSNSNNNNGPTKRASTGNSSNLSNTTSSTAVIPNSENLINNREPTSLSNVNLSGSTPKLEASGNDQEIINPNSIFYMNSAIDVKDWSQLHQLINTNIEITYKNFKDTRFSSGNYFKSLDKLTSTFLHVNLAFNLVKPQNFKNNDDYDLIWNEKTHKKKFQLLLKKIFSILSSISVDSTLYYYSYSTIPKDSLESLCKDIDTSYAKLSNIVPLLFQSIANNSNSSTGSNITHSKDNSLEFSNIVFPQITPRFLRNSFNGGSWVNPFVNVNKRPIIPNEFINPSHSSNAPLKKKALSYGSSSISSINSSKQKAVFPLNYDTLSQLQKRAKQVNDKVFANQGEHIGVLDQPRSMQRDLEINLKAYDEFNSNLAILRILEGLDLSIFINLISFTSETTTKDVDDKCSIKSCFDDGSAIFEQEDDVKLLLDEETKEFVAHAIDSMSTTLIDFFDVKQLMHDVVIKIIMCAQQTTLEDPFSFCSMKSSDPVGYNEPIMSVEKLAMFNDHDELLKSMIAKDVEINMIHFTDYTLILRETCERYAEISNLCCIHVENLIQERENILNYAARMMKNDLINELIKNEHQDISWFGNEPDNELSQFTNTDNELEKQADYPWYLKLEYESDLILDAKNRIKGGNVYALIEHLVNHQFLDKNYSVIMLLTLLSVFNKKQSDEELNSLKGFIYCLIHKYNSQPPEGLGYGEYNIWLEEKSTPTKKNIVKILHLFFSKFWSTYYYDKSYMNQNKDNLIFKFMEYAVYEKIPLAEELLDIYKKIIESKGSYATAKMTNSFADSPKIQFFIDNIQYHHEAEPYSLYGSKSISQQSGSSGIFFKFNKKLKLLDIDPFVFATQLTLIDEKLYTKISAFDCLHRVWRDIGSSSSKSISHFISNANKLTNFVSYIIVTQPEVKKRAKLIQFWITVAIHCQAMNNFSSMTAIISALYSSPIYRLTKTWKLIGVDHVENLKALNNLMNSTKNFLNYREKVGSINKSIPCVPFFGVFLSDLTFVASGNPDFLDPRSTIINFYKRRRVVEIIQEIIKFKQVRYKINTYEEVKEFIVNNTENIPHIEKQYELSLVIEPRYDGGANLSPSNSVFTTHHHGQKGTTSGTIDPKGSTTHHRSKFLKVGGGKK
ncbi:hypothetical protein Kpol_1026p32 [Vanderwaltozyma polyspora DSM 70294]|uniref:Ras GEF n=1 Tax=Vanderwaltozyma polyspora (strain ATCC 22028 / DSM 70294 / BCRC 21397 / CBS 2163 / NBRC 10782 / NRRL Y-8283 / UCD 57-17) TaxID=436907 RepID=A7TNK1_VANPO|nr:uncharacterized protein Kpol_1026p32 [Vanderwaltozyma polyspora DSM 70294]EDO16184.1 hypothetical protein Kpol_1026p32 [Vanderwaltozyma polyspora DSM 70294]